jgi:low affinity Fe/Cu permease
LTGAHPRLRVEASADMMAAMSHVDSRCPPPKGFNARLQALSTRITAWAGSTTAILLAFSSVALWAATGPVFRFSNTWQLVINTGTTVITFLMVFLIQRAQNKDALAIQLKLNEIVAAVKGADNRLIDIEDLSEEQLKQLREHYQRLAANVGESIEALTTRGSERRQNDLLARQRHEAGPGSPRS